MANDNNGEKTQRREEKKQERDRERILHLQVLRNCEIGPNAAKKLICSSSSF